MEDSSISDDLKKDDIPKSVGFDKKLAELNKIPEHIIDNKALKDYSLDPVFKNYSNLNLDEILNYVYEQNGTNADNLASHTRMPKIKSEELLMYLREQALLEQNQREDYFLTELGKIRLMQSPLHNK